MVCAVSNIIEKDLTIYSKPAINRISNMLKDDITKELLEELYYTNKNTLEEIGNRFGACAFSIAKLMDQYGLKRRNRSEATYNYFNKKECFNVRFSLENESKLLKNIALMLYWCEGTGDSKKGKKNVTLAFTNTDVDMLRIWFKFLFEVCGLEQAKIRIRLYLHKNQNGPKLKKYWSDILKVPLSQFESVSYTHKISTRKDYRGTVKVRVHNLKLYLLVKNWIDDLKKRILETHL